MSFKSPPLPPEPEIKPPPPVEALQPKTVPAKSIELPPKGHLPSFLAAATKLSPEAIKGATFVPLAPAFVETYVRLRGSDRWAKLITNEMKLIEIWLEPNPKNPIQYGWDLLDLLDVLAIPKSEICWTHKTINLEKATTEPSKVELPKPAPAPEPEPPKMDASKNGHLYLQAEAEKEFSLDAKQIPAWLAEGKIAAFRMGDKQLFLYSDLFALVYPTVAAEVKPVEPKKPPPPVVQFKNVTKTYGGEKPYTAIKDVSFVVEDLPAIGEMIAILGPSGCGKSTVLKLIAGLHPQHPATTGEVLVLGKPVSGPGADRGMVFQEYTAFPNRTVIDNIAFGLECKGMNKKLRHELASHWMEKVGLKPGNDAHKFPHQLSGGMRQRVAIARSLVLSPRILLMDEPFGALDPMTSMRMQDLLISLWKNSETTVFFVTHSIPEAVFLGDRVYLFSNAPGTIVEEVASPRPEEPAVDAYQKNDFQEKVKAIRLKIAKMEEEKGVL